MYDPIIDVLKKDEKYYVVLTPEIEGLYIYTSFDFSEPDRSYPKYKEPIINTQRCQNAKDCNVQKKRKKGRIMSIRVNDLKFRANR